MKVVRVSKRPAVFARAGSWDPLRDLGSIQNEVSRLFGRTFGDDAVQTEVRGTWSPSLDVFETEEKFSIVVELPGMEAGEVEITAHENVLTISGEREFSGEVEQDNFHRIERRYGPFSRSITLPKGSDSSRIEATMDNGLLTIVVPKSELAKPQRIEVKDSNAG